ncbi:MULTISPECIES: sugar phosphate isomerase/epimerase family protein [unclassified Morganella (in: enterobacteria)]|uniref:sugar phosphate isomerase/epimerase family protein n=1 Tax=unclassified Morganella (in: enterobacteria) TaxID=2676694 RepID=UPI002941DC4F|nr:MULTISPECIES: TIM barrel protein [unclassified Morganella (in: enterobacteria)]
MNTDDARRIIERADTLPLYLHAYAYHLNMRFEKILPGDLLDIANEQHLPGVKIHVLDGETQSLSAMTDDQLAVFAEKAKRYHLDINIETSASDNKTLDEAIRIALKTGASSVRFYPRYEGALSDVLRLIAADIRYLKEHYQHSGLTFVLEQHEDLKGHELVSLIKDADFPELTLLFDFGNMINACELPMDALADMQEYITQVHIKDAVILEEGDGFGHKACRSGEGNLPFKDMLRALICLGEDKPQVISYGLEEEVDYYAPAFRFKNESNDPWIPWRQMSETPLPETEIAERLAGEKKDAVNQIHYVRKIINELKTEAVMIISK